MTTDLELQEHLHICRECAEYARVSELLQTALAAAQTDDSFNIVSIEQQRERVEQRLRARGLRARQAIAVTNLSPRWFFFLRPSVRWSLSAVTLALLALVFIPFNHYHTVGYDLSVDGVSRELALNHEQMCEILTKLGLVEAGVEVLACDTTCCVSILDLKSEREAHLVAGAIARLSETDLTTNIVPIRAKSSRTLIEQANELIRRGV
jgi:hypothetical protein